MNRIRFHRIIAADLLLILLGSVLCSVLALRRAGDVNDDGQITASDASALFRIAVGRSMSGLLPEEVDLTGDNSVTRADVRAALLASIGALPDPDRLPQIIAASILGEEAMERFSYTGPKKTDHSYRSETISAEITHLEFQNSICHVLDLYVRDITALRTAFSSGKFNGKRQMPQKIASESGAIFASTGDMYSMNARGTIVRNGEWYDLSEGVYRKRDLCVLYTDGTMEIFLKGTVSAEELRNGKPIWQMWVFGPKLLDDNAEPMHEFNCSPTILGNNPRSAIGYYGPGHYCLVIVDGRQAPYSSGLTMEDLADLMYQLGCVEAYNLDGGKSAAMVDGEGHTVSSPSSGGRSISDIVLITEPMQVPDV